MVHGYGKDANVRYTTNVLLKETYSECLSDLKLLDNYLDSTRFARFLLSMAKISQHGTSKTYRFVPVQDFSKVWADEDLYAKYGLTEEKIVFIESMIKPME